MTDERMDYLEGLSKGSIDDPYFTGTVVRGPWIIPMPKPEPPEWWLDLKAGLTIGAGASAVMAMAVFLAVLALKAEGALP